MVKRIKEKNRVLIYNSEIGCVIADWSIDDNKSNRLGFFLKNGVARSYVHPIDNCLFGFYKDGVCECEQISIGKIKIGDNDRNRKLVFGNRTVIYRRGSGRIETITDFKKEFFDGLYKFFNHRDSEVFFSFFIKGIREGEKIEKDL